MYTLFLIRQVFRTWRVFFCPGSQGSDLERGTETKDRREWSEND